MAKKYSSVLPKIIIWIAIAIIFFVSGSSFLSVGTALFAAANATIFIAIVLINELWLFPKFYMTKRKKFIIYNLFVSIGFTIIHLSLDILVMPKEVMRNFEYMSIPLMFPILKSFSMVMLGNFISITLLLSTELKSRAVKEKKLKEEKLGTEIKLLKAQINPHFIFNALNNIYSLTYTKSKTAPESILKLSEMLRYVFYDCSSDHVKLGAEIDYISNFIAFQQMKSEHKQNIQFEYNGIKTNIYIAPMLFITFIENSFKYSKIEESTEAYVKISLKTNHQYLVFEIENSIPFEVKILSGNEMGINNVRQRLNLLYPNKYKLDINENETKFLVNLKIEL